MRNIIAGVVLTGCMLPFAVGSMKVANEFTKVTAAHEFSDLDSQPLWTLDARRVDVTSQNYERIPGIIVPENIVAKAETGESKMLGSTAGDVTAEAQSGDVQVQLAVQAWCSERYRSYDPSDNSYQPYGGAARKPCVAPASVTSDMQQASLASASSLTDEHVTWCSSRYSSYRVEDNSYQPFSGGRKQCSSPVDQAGSEILSRASGVTASIN